MKISVIGAGNVGATAALFLAQKELGDVVLVDVVEGIPQGKALDLREAAPVLGFSGSVTGTNSFEDIRDSRMVIITAGLARKPGMTREDLLLKNAGIIKGIVENIKKYAPQAFILVVTNPLDIMTYYALKVSGFPRSRVFGQAGVLDGSRFACFIGEELNVPVRDIAPLVLGGHGDTMVPLPRLTTVRGRPVTELMDAATLARLIKRTCNAGAEIVSLLKTGSAYYSPAASAVAMAEAVLKDQKTVMPVSVLLEGEYGLKDVCIGVPVKLGKAGVEGIIELELNQEERAALHASADIYKAGLKELPDGV